MTYQAMNIRPAVATLADIKPILPLLYSTASAAVMASALDRAAQLTGSRSLSQIPADVVAWEALAATIVWTGKFRADTPKKAKANFDKFVARVSAIIRRAQSFGSPAPALPAGVEAEWDALADYVDDAQKTFGPDGKLILPNMSDVSIANLRARVGQVAPSAITTDVVRAALIAAPAGKRDSLRRSVRFFNRMIANRDLHAHIGHLLPPAPIGALPVLRDAALDWHTFGPGFLASRDAGIEAAVRPQSKRRGRDRFGGRLGAPALRGAPAGAGQRRRPIRNPEAARTSHHAALSWLARHAYPDPASRARLCNLGDLVTEENIERALRAYIERAEKSDILAAADETSSMTTWLSNLATLARRGLADEDLGWAIDELKFEEGVETFAAREMSASRAAFVRLIDYDPSVARTIVLGPQTLYAEAMRGMAQWKTLGTNARIEVLHLLAAAAMWAIQIGRPLRTRNLNELTCDGPMPQINAPRSEEADPFLFITRSKVKNRRDIEGRIHPGYWKIVNAWIKEGRPRFIDIHKGRGFVDNDFLFPGEKGPLSRQALNKFWNRSVNLLGIPGLTPHMMRHVVATLHLAIRPGDYAVVAAMLCDKISTVEKFYARGEGRAASDLFMKALAEVHPEVRAMLREAA
jgi:hypothetical protein